MKKTSFFIAVIVIFVSILAIYGIVTVMMDNTGKINQGTYRINDVMSKSTIVYNEKEIKNEGKNGLSDISFDLTQDNLLSVLVAKNVNAKRIYINNVNISTPKYHGNMYISQNNTEEKISNDSAEKELNIYPDELDGEYFFEGYVSFTYNCTAEEIPEMQAEIDETAEEILSKIPSGADQWEAARIIHDELCRRVTYDQSLKGEHIRDIYGALVEGSAVCVGYAYAFDYLMEKAVSDSSCGTLESDDRTHAWNLVRFQEGDDDYALFLDVTWDDTDL